MKNALLIMTLMLMTFSAKAANHKLNFNEPVKLTKVEFKFAQTLSLSNLYQNVLMEKKLITKR